MKTNNCYLYTADPLVIRMYDIKEVIDLYGEDPQMTKRHKEKTKTEKELLKLGYQYVWIQIGDIYTSEFAIENIDDLPEQVNNIIQRIKKKYAGKDYSQIQLSYVEAGQGCWGEYESASYIVKGKRLETEKEFKDRIAEKEKQTNWRKLQYENLKKEFEGK